MTLSMDSYYKGDLKKRELSREGLKTPIINLMKVGE